MGYGRVSTDGRSTTQRLGGLRRAPILSCLTTSPLSTPTGQIEPDKKGRYMTDAGIVVQGAYL